MKSPNYLRVLVFLLLAAGFRATAAANGDVMLMGGGSHSGRLYIEIGGTEGTVCSEGFNMAAAHAACREMGFIKATKYGHNATAMGFSVPSNDTQILLSNVRCPSVDSDLVQYNSEWHILRCAHDTPLSVPGICNHTDNDVGIVCGSTRLLYSPYNSQVRLKPSMYLTPPSTVSQGTLNVYLNENWGEVCYHGFSQTDADTVCAQRGFTNAVSFNSTEVEPGALIWLDSVSCGKVRPCFYHCFDYPSKDDGLNDCPSGMVVTVLCEFNISLSDTYRSGSHTLCNLERSEYYLLIIDVVTAVVVTLVLTVTVTITLIISCCCVTRCPFHRYRSRRYYRQII